jgi:hypothetical protein
MMENVLAGNPYSPLQNWGLGNYCLMGSAIIMKPPKGTSLRESVSFEPLYVFLRRPVRAVRASEERYRTADFNQNWHILRSRRRY